MNYPSLKDLAFFNMKRAFVAFIVGGAFVCLVFLLGHLQFATPIPFLLLSPGIFAGACVPGSGFNPEGDLHPWGALSVCAVIGVDVGIYGGMAYLFLFLLDRLRRTSLVVFR